MNEKRDLDGRLTIIGIHGVGRSEPGSVRSSIAEALGSHGRADVHEVHWASLLDPNGVVLLEATALGRLTHAVLVAGSRGFTYGVDFRRSRVAADVIRAVDTLAILVFICTILLAP